MKPQLASSMLIVLSIPLAIAQQNGAPLPLPAPTPAPRANAPAEVTKKDAGDINAELLDARAATKDHRYGDSETLMLEVTEANPHLVLPWVELGLAQMGLEKYAQAEEDFKKALGIDPESQAIAHNQDFYQAADAPGIVAPGATRASRNTAGGSVVTTGHQRTPDVLGTAYASLGEVYVHEKKYDEAQRAFDEAVKDYPTEAAQYRRNETILFFKAGQPDLQLAAANEAIALDPNRAMLYYFKGQALVSKATIDPRTQKITLPADCVDAYEKYLHLEPAGEFSADAKGVLTAAGVAVKTGRGK